MKIEQINCDFCEKQLFYHNEQSGKKFNEWRYIHFVGNVYDKEGVSVNYDYYFCSPNCLADYLRIKIYDEPEINIFNNLAEKLGYEVKKKTELETKTQNKNQRDDKQF